MVDFPADDYWRVQEAIDSTASLFAAGKAVFNSARAMKKKQRRKKNITETRFKCTVICSLEALIYSLSLFMQHFDTHDMRKPELLKICAGASDSAFRCIMSSNNKHLWDRIRDSMN